jgi:hypothetical protein
MAWSDPDDAAGAFPPLAIGSQPPPPAYPPPFPPLGVQPSMGLFGVGDPAVPASMGNDSQARPFAPLDNVPPLGTGPPREPPPALNVGEEGGAGPPGIAPPLPPAGASPLLPPRMVPPSPPFSPPGDLLPRPIRLGVRQAPRIAPSRGSPSFPVPSPPLSPPASRGDPVTEAPSAAQSQRATSPAEQARIETDVKVTDVEALPTAAAAMRPADVNVESPGHASVPRGSEKGFSAHSVRAWLPQH